MSKVITVVGFLVLTTTGAFFVACGDSPAAPPATPSGGPSAPTSPAASSAAPTAPKGGW